MDNLNQFTISISLEKYGIKNTQEIIYNPSFEFLYNEELNPNLEGFEKGQLSEFGAVNVMTGVFTGRSPKDKYIVKLQASAMLNAGNRVEQWSLYTEQRGGVLRSCVLHTGARTASTTE